MEIVDNTRKDKRPYMGIREILSAVTLGGKQSDVTPNLPEAVVKSIFKEHLIRTRSFLHALGALGQKSGIMELIELLVWQL